MWIIPKNHPLSSAFAQDTVASKEELSEHLEDQLTHSLMSRSKTIPLKTWCRRWKTDSSVPALFGRTLKPSHAKRFEEELTSLLEGIRANRFLQQDKDLGKTIQDTCGPTSPKLYEVSAQEWSSLKTSKDISTEDSKKLSKTWKALVTKRRGEYSQRVKQAHLIRESESLSWPTATARDWKGVYPPTGLIRNDGKLRCDLLTDAVEYLPQTSTGKLTKEDVPSMVKSYKMLNPSWVESLMGLPEGWTQLGTLSVDDWKGWPSRPGTEQFNYEEPRTLPKGDDGLINRVDRLRMLGNGVVPQSAEIALEVLSKQLINGDVK